MMNPNLRRQLVGLDSQNTRQAFSLIEVMVVISVIAVLAGVLFAVFSASLERSRNVQCVSKLRYIGVGLDLFVAENGYYMGANPTVKTSWHQVLEPYMSGHHADYPISHAAEWIQCPARNQLADDPVIGYGYNYLGFGHHSPDSGRWDAPGAEYMKSYWHLSPARIENPADVIIIGDNHDPGSGSNYIDRLLYSTLSGKAFSRRHGGGGNYLFADGHVGSMTPEELVKELQKDGGRKSILLPF